MMKENKNEESRNEKQENKNYKSKSGNILERKKGKK